MHTTRGLKPWAIAAALFLMGCADPNYSAERAKHECGFPGNGCWADSTCNEGNVCRVKRKSEPLPTGVCPATYGVCERGPGQDASVVDGKRTIDGPKAATEEKSHEMKPDGPRDGGSTDQKRSAQ